MEEIFGIVSHITLFDELNLSEVESLCGFVSCFGAPRNVTLIEEGTQGNFLLIVLTGSVRVVKEATNGGPATVTTVGPGAGLGEMSMIDGEPRFASCTTVEPTDFAVLSRDDLNRILKDMPRLGNKFLLLLLLEMTKRLRETSTRLLPHIGGLAV